MARFAAGPRSALALALVLALAPVAAAVTTASAETTPVTGTEAATRGWAMTPSARAAAEAFADAPSWTALESYAWELHTAWQERGIGEPPAKDAMLEAMKAELAKGFYGAPPPPRTDMARLRDLAAGVRAPGTRVEATLIATRRIVDALQLWDLPFHEATPGGNARVLAVAGAIDLPPVRPSLFRGENDLAAPHEDPEAISGRFGLVHRWVTTAPVEVDGFRPALYDIGGHAHLLTRPVQRVVLQRDGGLQVAPSHARRHQPAYDEHGCEGWHPGYAHGDLAADDTAWHSFDGEYGLADARTDAGHVPGSVYSFYVPTATVLPQSKATVSTREQVLDPEATGFVRATSLVYDLDHDAVPDLMVWEAAGQGPGHMDSPTGSDDTWYRLVLVNIGGQWKVLGVDLFSYGCGC